MSMLSNWFGKKKDTTYTGPKPLASLRTIEPGQKYYQTLVDRMAGRGVGYGEGYVQSGNPIIQNKRAQFTGYTLPELKSELSLTGRRKGSAGFAQLDKAYRQEGLDENEIIANLIQRNEEQKRNEINDAVTGMGNFANNEANLAGNYANFENANNNRQIAEAQALRDKQSALVDRGLQTAGAVMGIPIAGSSGSSSFGGSSLLQQLLSRMQPTVSSGGFNTMFNYGGSSFKPTTYPKANVPKIKLAN